MAKWKLGTAEDFFEDIMKPKRLQKIEDYYKDSERTVEFEESDAGYWMVLLRGVFQDFELAEMNRTLKQANRLKPL